MPIDDAHDRTQAADAEPSSARSSSPSAPEHEPLTGIDLDRRCFVARKRIEHELETGADPVYFPSLSARTLVYKGMLTTGQLGEFFPDLADERVESALALVHSRFSTNTFPSWPLAHPYRFIAHNGEINTVMGNHNWMRAREALLETDLLGGPRAHLPDLHARRLRHRQLRRGARAAAPRRLPAPPRRADDDPRGVGEPRVDARRKRAFYRFHGAVMEPWDGPASIAFTDGTVIGAVLDRNGLRPSRYWVTDDGLVIMASEVGVLPIDPADRSCRRAGCSRAACSSSTPPRAASSTTTRSRRRWPPQQPYDEWLHAGLVHLDDLPARGLPRPRSTRRW